MRRTSSSHLHVIVVVSVCLFLSLREYRCCDERRRVWIVSKHTRLFPIFEGVHPFSSYDPKYTNAPRANTRQFEVNSSGLDHGTTLYQNIVRLLWIISRPWQEIWLNSVFFFQRLCCLATHLEQSHSTFAAINTPNGLCPVLQSKRKSLYICLGKASMDAADSNEDAVNIQR